MQPRRLLITLAICWFTDSHLLGYDHEDDFDAKHMRREANSCRVWRRYPYH